MSRIIWMVSCDNCKALLVRVWKDSNIPSPIKRLNHHKANNINLLNPYRMPRFMKRDDYKSGSERKYCTLYLWNSPGLFSRHLIQYAFLVSVIQDYTINGIKLKVWLCRTKRSAIQWVHIKLISCEWVRATDWRLWAWLPLNCAPPILS